MKKVLVFSVVMLCLSGFAWAQQQVTINGGSYTDYINDGDDLTINGGVFSGQRMGIQVSQGTVAIYGGSISGEDDAIYCSGGTTSIYGGTFSGNNCAIDNNGGTISIYGGTFSGDYFSINTTGGTITLYGTFAQYGALSTDPYYHYQGDIDGILATGTGIIISYSGQNGEIYLEPTPIPEPSSILALLCGIGGMGGMILKRKLDP